MRARDFKFCIHGDGLTVTYRGLKLIVQKKTMMLKCILPSFFPLFLFSISQSNVMHREICGKDCSGTIRPRISKDCTNIGVDLFVRENQHPPAYHSLYLFIFLFVLIKIHHRCVSQNQDAEIYFLCPSLPCNYKGNLHL